MFELTGKNILVTGSSKGIGQAIAISLAQKGANIAIHYNKTSPTATLKAVQSCGGKVITVQADFTKISAKTFYAEVVEMIGSLDILINNAAIAVAKPIEAVTEEEFDNLFTINTKFVYFMCKEAIRNMKPGSKIINISGVGTRMMTSNFSYYLASKGAVEQMTRQLAIEAANRGICINAIAPGATETEMTLACNNPAAIDAVAKITAFNRLGKPKDISEVISLFVSGMADWVTGQVIHVNGGLL